MGGKQCSHHEGKQRKFFRRLFLGIVIFLAIAGITVLIVWAILQPHKPTFILQDATVFAFNLTTPNILNAVFQVTLSSRNPNDKIGVYYDKLDVYAVYRNQQITLRTVIQKTYQGHKEVDVWSPYLYGNSIPIAPYTAVALNQDQTVGVIPLMIKIDGRVRWKVGTFVSGRYHLYANCPAIINTGNPPAGTVVDRNAIKYQLIERCSVNV